MASCSEGTQDATAPQAVALEDPASLRPLLATKAEATALVTVERLLILSGRPRSLVGVPMLA